MENKIDFSLPEDNTKKVNVTQMIIVVLLFILIIITAADFVLQFAQVSKTDQHKSAGFTAENIEDIATRLSSRKLYIPAIKTWQEYLAQNNIDDNERARILFEIAKLYQEAANYDSAIEYYYRSETIAKISDLSHEIDSGIKTCFEKLGQFSSLRYELMDRTSFKQDKPAGSEVIAEIGPEKITQADLDAIIEKQIDNQLNQYSAFMSQEQLMEQKKRMLDQFRDPQTRLQQLQSWLAMELLYRQGLQLGMSQDEKIREMIDEATKRIISQQLMNNELASKINITETDLRNYYMANKEQYIEESKAKISHILVEDEQTAIDVIAKINEGGDFAELAKEYSKDTSTAENGGIIDSDIVKGAYVPGVGNDEQLNKAIFSTGKGEIIEKPYKTDKGWEIIKVENITEERQKEFDEVSQEVMRQLTSQKNMEVQQALIKELMDKNNVVIHQSKFTSNAQGQEPENK